MCGICGTVRFARGASPAPELLDRMTAALVHRGPDDSGAIIDGPAAMAIRRLSIIDLSTGRQPIANEAGDVHVVVNGEIYNYRELRERLIASGHRFRTRSDAEVVVHLYEEKSDAFLGELDGMFALAVWDGRNRRLLLARDRLGEKPLYVHADARRLVFASELKAILQCDDVPGELDLQSLSHYFAFLSVPGSRSIVRGVRKILPGHALVCEPSGRVRDFRYWDITGWDTADVTSESAAADELRARLEVAVRERLMADVPVGAFLSGGIDSSVVVALMQRFSNRPVKTFAIGFQGPEYYDELPYAREVARYLGTEHHEYRVRPDVAGMLAELTWYFDEPFAVSSAVPLYLLACRAREQVTVVLTGDGGDEVFAGYPRYRWDHAAERLRHVMPRPTRTLLSRATSAAAGVGSPWALQLRRAHKFAKSLTLSADERFALYVSPGDYDRDRTIFHHDLHSELARLRLLETETLARQYAGFDGHTPLNRRLYGDLKTSLADEMLSKVDRMTMAASLEARPPLLDYQLVEFMARLGPKFKQRGAHQKVLLKRAAADLVPPAVLTRKKHGFEVPLDQWFRGELRSLIKDELASSSFRDLGLFDLNGVSALIDAHLSRRANNGHRLWALLVFHLWHRRVLGNRRVAPTALRPSVVVAGAAVTH